MATLDQLNFEVILNDDAFNKQVEKIQKVAGDLNASLSSILNVKGNMTPFDDAYVQNVKNVAKAYREIAAAEADAAKKASGARTKESVDNAKATAAAVKEAAKARGIEQREALKTRITQERLNQLQREHNSLLGRNNRLWREMGTMLAAYFSVHGAVSLVKTLTRVTAEFELQKVTLGAILQDTETANKLFEQLKVLAVKSPFQFKELATYAKQLSAFSIPAKELYDTTKMLADVSAGLGVGMDRLVLAYGQIRSASFLRGQEVRQLTEAGIPILEELRKQFVALGEEGITVGDVFDKISKRMVPFEMVEKVFKDMTSEGGKFYQMQEVQAETLKGKISNLTDAYQIMFAEIGDRNNGMLKGAVDVARSLAENYEKVGRILVTLIASYTAYKVAYAAVLPLQKAHMLAAMKDISVMEAFNAVMARSIAQTKAFKAVQAAFSNPWVLLIAGITAYLSYMASLTIQAERFKKELNNIASSHYEAFQKQEKHLHELVQQLKNAERGSADYREAIRQLNSQYGEYLPNLLTEKSTLLDIAEAERQATNALRERMRAQAESEGLSKIQGKEGQKMSNAALNLAKTLQGKGVAEESAHKFVENFRIALEQGSGSVESVFNSELQKWLGDDYYRWGDESVRYWNEMLPQAQKYGDEVRKVAGMQKDLSDALDMNFGKGVFETAEEMERIGAIEEKYEEKKKEYARTAMSDEERNGKILEDNKAKLKEMLAAYEDMARVAEQRGSKGMYNTQINDINRQIKELEGAEQSWLQKVVNPIASGYGLQELVVQAGDSLGEIADKARKQYKSVTEQLEDAKDAYTHFINERKRGNEVDEKSLKESEDLVKSLENQKNGIEAIGKAIGISVNDKVKTPKTGSSGKSQEQESLEIRRDTLKDIYKWYQKLTDEGMDGQSIKELLTNYFPDEKEVIEGEKYKQVLLEIADALEEYDRKMAQALRDDVNGRSIDADYEKWKKAKDAAEKYQDFMENWLDETDLWGENGAAKISKIVRKYNKTLEQIQKKRSEAIEKLNEKAETSQTWGLSYIEEGQKIDAKAATEEANALLEAKAEAKAAIEEIYKTWRDNNLDFNNLSDKTIAQLRRFQEVIDAFSVSNITPDDLKGFEQLQLTKEQIQELIDEIKKGDLSKTGSEINNKNITAWKMLAQNILSAADALKEYGEASGNADIAGIAEGISFMGDVVKNALEGFKKGDLLGAVVAGVATVADYILNAATQAARLKAELREMLEQRYLDEIDERLKSAETIFGDSWMGKIRGLRTEIRGLTRDIKNLVNNTYTQVSASGGAPPKMLEALQKYAKELKMELYGEDGLLNPDTLEAIKKANPYTFSDKYESGQNLNKLIDYAKKVKELYADLEESVGGMFDSLSGDIADSLIESLKATGSAVTDLEDVFQGLGDAIFKSMVQSFVIDEVLNKYKDEVMSWWTDETLTEADIANRIRAFAESVKHDIEIADDRISAMYDAFMDNSLLSVADEAEDKSNLGSGVKSITEDTANLLASYINAIRADVAAIRQSVAAEGAMNLPTPTLAEYLTQIQANTYNNAIAAQNILERLDSVMTMSDGPAFRVFM
jgi:hypothetical protein